LTTFRAGDPSGFPHSTAFEKLEPLDTVCGDLVENQRTEAAIVILQSLNRI
jgi:hypothetical protein